MDRVYEYDAVQHTALKDQRVSVAPTQNKDLIY
jgi:hypothetical protein